MNDHGGPPAIFATAEHPSIEHLAEHDRPSEHCAHCAAAMLLPALHDAFWSSDETHELIWSMQDGYGEAGYTPDQGVDWSGVRDSHPATIWAMHRAVFGPEAVTRS